jgi:hypothetical protein
MISPIEGRMWNTSLSKYSNSRETDGMRIPHKEETV